MSFKGFQKSLVRAPQTFKAKFNLGEQTKDAVYMDAERRFQELETETKKLHDESKKYFEAINGMMNHQIEFSKAIAEIYKPISGRMSDPDSIVQEGNPEGIRACEEYEEICKELLATLQPELEMIEARVIRPADELLEIIKVIRKTSLKRQHKQLDFDRHRATLKKLQDKKEKSLKDEKAMYKAESDVEQATQEFNYYNDLLKDELPKLFTLEREFIRPLFQSFYYMQLNVFYTLHDRMQGCDIGYFNLQLDIEEGFEAKRGDIREQTEALAIVKFKTTGAKRPPKPLALGGPKRLAIEDKPSSTELSTSPNRRASTDFSSSEKPPPPYSSMLSPTNPGNTVMRSASTGSSWGAAAKAKKAAPPPPKPKPSRLSGAPATETAVALYDYEAQAEGDLSFSAGETIDIVTRTGNENEWWIGKIHGKQGQFPVSNEPRLSNKGLQSRALQRGEEFTG
ncbi:putative BAR adaptor protein [Sclerotinia borealis F-4128]|uniref:Putative BAR adaptor protein n=1 Tax=Sclerotinia borealis (strain F-4128) TaxID=1432307 RepID=W9CF13_SCLBF|nr:putative BAR adaptor protein [Sclerotinia borealis F-4128]